MKISPGKWIQERRTYLRLTRVELASAIACSPDTIKKIETGKRRPSMQIAEALAASLKIDQQVTDDFLRFVRWDQTASLHSPNEPTHQPPSFRFITPQNSTVLDPIQVLGRLPPLPHQQLFGVAERLDRIEPLLMATSRPWLISIEGIGGIGKTTLAHTLVQRLMTSGRFDDIGWVSAKQEEYVTGRGIRPVYDALPALDEETLIDTLLAQLADGPYPIDNKFAKRAALHQLLQTKACLIVVDNLESVADYEALLPLLRYLSRPSKFLITSRMSLQQDSDISTESVSELSKRDTLDFLRHVAGEQHNPQLLAAGLPLLEEIYQTVGGNPLALKLVVGQASLMPLSEVLNSIRLTGSANADQLYLYIYRQAWEMLGDAGRKLLLALPIVPNGTFKQLAISSELAPFEIHAALNQLRTLSLVDIGQGQENEEPRYRIHRLTETFLMHEVVKWGDEEKETPTAEGLFFEDRVVAMVDHWRSSHALSKSLIEQLDQEKEGMLTAVRLSLAIPAAWDASKALIEALSSYMERRGHWSEWQAILEDAIVVAQAQEDSKGEIELMGMRGRILQRQGKEDEVVKNYHRVIRRARQAGEEIELARACSNLGYTLIERVQWWRSEILCCAALEIFTKHDHLHGLAHTHNHLGFLYTRMQEFDRGAGHLENACRLWVELDDSGGLILGYLNLSALSLDTQQPGKALEWVNKGLLQADESSEISHKISLFINGAYANTELDHFEQALDMAKNAERLAQKYTRLNDVCLAWGNLGFIHAKQNKWGIAEAYFAEATKGFEKTNNHRQLISLEEKRAAVFINAGRKPEAKEAINSLSNLCRGVPNKLNLEILDASQRLYSHRFS